MQIDMVAISELIRSEVRKYIYSAQSPSLETDPDNGQRDTAKAEQGEDSALYMTHNLAPKEYPPVLVLPESQMLRILVTGGAGFVGSHLVDRYGTVRVRFRMIQNLKLKAFILISAFLSFHHSPSPSLFSWRVPRLRVFSSQPHCSSSLFFIFSPSSLFADC